MWGTTRQSHTANYKYHVQIKLKSDSMLRTRHWSTCVPFSLKIPLWQSEAMLLSHYVHAPPEDVVLMSSAAECLIATGGSELGKVRTPSHRTVCYTEQAQMASPPHVMSRLHNWALSYQNTDTPTTRRLTEDGECEQKVREQLGADFGTFGLRPGLDGLQVTLVHPHLNLFRHTVGTVIEKRHTLNCDEQNAGPFQKHTTGETG